jgi:hypothetical protein
MIGDEYTYPVMDPSEVEMLRHAVSGNSNDAEAAIAQMGPVYVVQRLLDDLQRAHEGQFAMHYPRAAMDVIVERRRQDRKWGEQNHPDGTGPDSLPLAFVHDPSSALELARLATQATDVRAVAGTVTWRDILREEYHEALAESDPEKLYRELIQVAAVAQQWAEAIVRRTTAETITP